MDQICIKTNQLSKRYGEFYALKQVNFELKKGEIYGLVGKNGAGKSTLIKLLMGLSVASEGEIELFQTKKNLEQQRRHIGFMMSDGFFPYLNARQNIDYFRKLKGIKEKSETDRVLKLVELDNVKKPFKSFSLGMKQRLAVANALLGYPEIVIMDEPINGLDPQGIADFRRMVLRINQELNTTFLISSHILSELDKMAHRFGFIDKGKLLMVLNHEDLEKQCKESFVVGVEQPEMVLPKLVEKFNLQQAVIEGSEIIIYDQQLDVSSLAEFIVTSGFKLSKLQPNKMTLEEFFLDMIGGNTRD